MKKPLHRRRHRYILKYICSFITNSEESLEAAAGISSKYISKSKMDILSFKTTYSLCAEQFRILAWCFQILNNYLSLKQPFWSCEYVFKSNNTQCSRTFGRFNHVQMFVTKGWKEQVIIRLRFIASSLFFFHFPFCPSTLCPLEHLDPSVLHLQPSISLSLTIPVMWKYLYALLSPSVLQHYYVWQL